MYIVNKCIYLVCNNFEVVYFVTVMNSGGWSGYGMAKSFFTHRSSRLHRCHAT